MENGRGLSWIAIAVSVVALIVALGGRGQSLPWQGYRYQGNSGPSFFQGPQQFNGPNGGQFNRPNAPPRFAPPRNFRRGPRAFPARPPRFGRGFFFFWPFWLIGGLGKLALLGLLGFMAFRWFANRDRPYRSGPPQPPGQNPPGPGAPPSGGNPTGPEKPPYTGETQNL